MFQNRRTSILCISFWGEEEGITKAGVIPYLLKLRHGLPISQKMYWITFEKHRIDKKSLKERKRVWKEKEIYWIPFRYYFFRWYRVFYYFFLLVWLRVRFFRIRALHCWCMPAAAIGYFLVFFSHKKFIVDSYEPHAEAMQQAGVWKKKSLSFLILSFLEKKITQRADTLIALTENMSFYMKKRYGIEKKIFVRPCCVDIKKFDYRLFNPEKTKKELGLHTHRIGVYSGKMGGLYLDEEIIAFFSCCFTYWKENFSMVLLTDAPSSHILSLCKKYSLPQKYIFHKHISFEQMPYYLSVADFALTMLKPIEVRKYCSPIKNGEYMAMGLPIISTKNISDDIHILSKEKIGYCLGSLDEKECLFAINEIENILQTPNYKKKIFQMALKHKNFTHYEKIYQKITSDLLSL